MEATQTANAANEGLRGTLHGMWASVADPWGEHAEYIDAQGAVLTKQMLGSVALKPGERVLELACGAGGVGLAAAALVAPGGDVVLSDVVIEMTSIAEARAKSLGVENVSAQVLDLEDIAQPNATFDAVLCREGLMFAVDHARAVREIYRVTKTGGRVAIAVWGPRDRNPWLGLVFDVVSAQLGVVVPPPGVPGPFALEDATNLESLFWDAGFADVSVTEVAVPRTIASFDGWWERTSALAGPLAKILESLPAEAVSALRDRARDAIRPYETSAGIEFPGVSLLALARRTA